MSTIAIIGLGYVGLPLSVELASRHSLIGFDLKRHRIEALITGHDSTLEVPDTDLAAAPIKFTSNPADLASATVFIVTVPTPIDDAKQPDLTPLKAASAIVGQALKPGDTVIYESTVYPGCTEEVCVPILEAESGLKFNTDFTVGYSPERINPGDHTHRLPDIKKVTSGSTPEAAEFIDNLYASIITAGTHRASSIRVAEAAKVIENTQRDVNIALINELAVLFNTLDLDTREVLEAAGTKWNFLPSAPAWSAGTASASTPTTSPTKPNKSATTPKSSSLAGASTTAWALTSLTNSSSPWPATARPAPPTGYSSSGSRSRRTAQTCATPASWTSSPACANTASRSTSATPGSTPTKPATNTASTSYPSTLSDPAPTRGLFWPSSTISSPISARDCAAGSVTASSTTSKVR